MLVYLMHEVVPRAVMAALMAAASSCSTNFTAFLVIGFIERVSFHLYAKSVGLSVAAALLLLLLVLGAVVDELSVLHLLGHAV